MFNSKGEHVVHCGKCLGKCNSWVYMAAKTRTVAKQMTLTVIGVMNLNCSDYDDAYDDYVDDSDDDDDESGERTYSSTVSSFRAFSVVSVELLIF